MNRDVFVRLAAVTLQQRGMPDPEGNAEAIAAAMELFGKIMGESTLAAASSGVTFQAGQAPPPPFRPSAFPAPNPEAVAPLAVGPGLIVPATRIPDRDEIGRAPAPTPEPPPLRSVRPQGRLKVEELNRIVQENTPLRLTFEVPMEDGGVQRVTFQRDVISMHNFDSVKLLYYPPSVTSQVARESVQVAYDLHIDDAPHDYPAILARLTAQAIESVRPRRIPQSAMPAPTSGPVKHAADTYRPMDASEDQTPRTLAVFNSLG